MTHGATKRGRIALTVATVAAALMLVVTHGPAQSERKAPTLFKAAPQKRDEPVKITAAKLEVRDKSKMATFSGDVHVIQGETNLRCKELVVFYDQDMASGSKKTADSGKSSNQQIRRMEAKGSVVVTQHEQRIVGDRADFDMRTNTVTMIGNVVVTKGDNVLRGQRMVVNLTTNVVQVDSSGGRVEGIFDSKSAPKPGKQH
ncbi:MAG: LPS ABC transporter substrate-binding protein LptA [Rhizobiales bacterium]|nr:LPS ABC transporter substrate-binding protein LptA [Hyphomicrobiales bacterium]